MYDTPMAFTGGFEDACLEKIPDYGTLEVELPVATKITRKVVRITRAKSGLKELRLLSELHNGVHVKYQIEDAQIIPYSARLQDLLAPRKKSPMTLIEAEASFEKLVSKTFTPCKLKSGKTIATHLNLI